MLASPSLADDPIDAPRLNDQLVALTALIKQQPTHPAFATTPRRVTAVASTVRMRATLGSACRAWTMGNASPGQRSLYQACPSHHALVLPSMALASSQKEVQKK